MAASFFCDERATEKLVRSCADLKLRRRLSNGGISGFGGC
jgi:hypothetical protein